MSIVELSSKAHSGDVVAVDRVLDTLEDDDVLEAFNLSTRVKDHPGAAFRILFWVTSRPRPEKEDHHLAWLRAMNNGTSAAIKQGTDAERLEMVTRAMEIAPDNISIYHNAACVYCVLGLAEEALDTIVSAAEQGYKNMALIAEDSDLDLIRDHPGFQALVEESSAEARAILDEIMARVSKEVLRGADVPSDLVRTWRGILARSEHSAPPLQREELYESRPSSEEISSILGGAWARLVEETDLVALRGDDGFIGYHRGEHGERTPADGPVLFFDESGHFEVAANFSELLVLVAQRRHEGMLYLKSFFNDTYQFAVETDPVVIRERMADVHRTLLDRLAEQAPDLADNADEFDDFAELVRPGEATFQVYFPRVIPRPWRCQQVMRVGGPPIGVSAERRPRHDGELMPHMLTVDLDVVPALRTKQCFLDRPELRAFAVFVAGRSTHVVGLTQDDIDNNGEWSGETVNDPARKQLRVHPLMVPKRLLEQEEVDDDESWLLLELEANAIGGPDPSNARPGHEFLMAFEGDYVYWRDE